MFGKHKFSGYTVEVDEVDAFRDFEAYVAAAAQQKLEVDVESETAKSERMSGITLAFSYMGNQLKAKGVIN